MMQNLWYLIVAYGVIWVVLFAYIFSVERRQKQLRDELTALEAGVAAGEWKETIGESAPAREEMGIPSLSP
ncbi:MAG: CcmD family protein [Chloroflexota bacterium]|nr:MAG: CcmD family protein [Chloroflexota bacterium]